MTFGRGRMLGSGGGVGEAEEGGCRACVGGFGGAVVVVFGCRRFGLVAVTGTGA